MTHETLTIGDCTAVRHGSGNTAAGDAARLQKIVCPLELILEVQPPIPPGFAVIVGDYFPALHDSDTFSHYS